MKHLDKFVVMLFVEDIEIEQAKFNIVQHKKEGEIEKALLTIYKKYPNGFAVKIKEEIDDNASNDFRVAYKIIFHIYEFHESEIC